MGELRPVTLKNGAFNFCKITIASLLWVSIIFQMKSLIILSLIILIFSAILKVKHAPLVILYTYTIEKMFPSKSIIVEEKSIQFAHIIGTVGCIISLVLMYFVNPLSGWIAIGILASLKSIAAFGFCGAAKLYTCVNNPNGTCCRFGKKIKNRSC